MSSAQNKLISILLGDARTSAAIISLFLSVWSVYLDDVVNTDGVLYLRTAELLAHGQWQDAFALYKWPFYAFLIAVISQITGLGFEYSAHALNAALTALAVAVFLSLVRELGADRKTLIAAAIVVLLFPGLNRYRAFVIRDAGYIAFYLLALLLFIKDLKGPRPALRLGWVASIFVATLFRIEGFVFLVALPLVRQWLLSTGATARAALLAGSAGAALLILGALGWWSFSGPQLPTAPEWGGLLGDLWHSTTATLSARIDTIAGALHDRYERAFAYAVLLAALCVLLLWEVLVTLTPLYTALAGHAVYRRLVFQDPQIRKIWLQLIALHLLVLAAILIIRLFLTGRFPLALSLTLLLAVPFSLAALYARWQEDRPRGVRRNWVFLLVCILLILTGADGLYRPTGKRHLKEAGLWVKNHTPTQTTLFSNDPLILWYSARSRHERPSGYAWDLVLELARSRRLLQYDYLAVRVKRTQSEQEHSLVEALGKRPVAVFANRKGDKALVFALH
ncbi:MAG: hypothetical protein OES46_12055 [Gammaproteobacteria bacterium]|nr:hypothetical protein [Gammaproteobacteria bacterium]